MWWPKDHSCRSLNPWVSEEMRRLSDPVPSNKSAYHFLASTLASKIWVSNSLRSSKQCSNRSIQAKTEVATWDVLPKCSLSRPRKKSQDRLTNPSSKLPSARKLTVRLTRDRTERSFRSTWRWRTSPQPPRIRTDAWLTRLLIKNFQIQLPINRRPRNISLNVPNSLQNTSYTITTWRKMLIKLYLESASNALKLSILIPVLLHILKRHLALRTWTSAVPRLDSHASTVFF